MSKIIITDDGNQRMSSVDAPVLKDPKDMPRLTVKHLMGTDVEAVTHDPQIGRNIDALLTPRVRAIAVGAFMFKNLLSNPVLLHELYLLGATSSGKGWVEQMKTTDRPDSLMHGLEDKWLYLAWETFKYNVELLGKRGAALRRRRDTTI